MTNALRDKKTPSASRLARWAVLAAAVGLAVAARSESGTAPADPVADAAERIRAAGLRSEGAYPILARLTREVGPRLTGSAGADAAVEWTRRLMDSLGFETWLEPVTVERWVRGEASAAIEGPSGRNLAVAALGGSVPTPAGGISGRVVEVGSTDELKTRAAEARGAIVFFNVPFDRTLADTFRAYGGVAAFRAQGPSRAAAAGAVAALVRSPTGRIDGHPHTGMLQYDEGSPRVPAAALATADADALSAALARDPRLLVRLELSCRGEGPVPSANVIGQIRGAEKPDEIVLLGGHLDSWDLGTGAHDDGAGCVQAIEALRLIAGLGLKPRRTIRAVMFMNEEFGATGGRDYAAAPKRKGERHLAAIESDRGGFLPLGFAAGGGDAASVRLRRRLEKLLAPSGISWVVPGGGGADIGPLAAGGTVMMSFIPNSQTYFDFHHSALDVIEAVHPRELELGAIVMAIAALAVAEEGI